MPPRHLLPSRCAALCLICGALACSSSSAPPRTATVQFAYSDRFCAGTTMTLQFLIDHVPVDTETLRSGQTSRDLMVTAGPHVLGARVSPSGLTLVPDTTVTLDANEVFTRQVVSITPEC